MSFVEIYSLLVIYRIGRYHGTVCLFGSAVIVGLELHKTVSSFVGQEHIGENMRRMVRVLGEVNKELPRQKSKDALPQTLVLADAVNKLLDSLLSGEKSVAPIAKSICGYYRDDILEKHIAIPLLRKVMHAANYRAREDLCMMLCKQRPLYKSAGLLLTVLRHSRSLTELSCLLKAMGDTQLKQFYKEMIPGSRLLRAELNSLRVAAEFLPYAHEMMGSCLELGPNSKRAVMLKRLRGLEEIIQGCRARLRQIEKKLPSGKSKYQKMLTYNLREIRELFKGQKKLTTPELRERVNTLIEKSRMELRYGVFFRHGLTSKWSYDTLRTIGDELMPKFSNDIWRTPELFTFQRVKSATAATLGERRKNGVITLTDLALHGNHYESMYAQIPGFILTLAHEIGHAVHYGNSTLYIKDPDWEHPFFPGDAHADLKLYLEIAGWTIIERSRWKTSDEMRNIVVVDGEEIPLGHAVTIDGQQLTCKLIEYENVSYLLAYNARRGFTADPYSRSEPNEDYAESFSLYFLDPKGLIASAPLKFQFHENLYRHYHGIKSIDSFLTSTLSKKIKGGLALDAYQEFLTDRFSALSSRRQAAVILRSKQSYEEVKRRDLYLGLEAIEELSERKRLIEFASCIRHVGRKVSASLEPVSEALYEQYEPLKISWFWMLHHICRGDEIGLLSTRNDRRGDQAVLDAINAFVKPYQIARNNIYYVQDNTRNTRLRAETPHGRVASILRDFVSGRFVDGEKEVQKLSQKFSAVYYYTANTKLRSQVKKRVSSLGIAPTRKMRIVLPDIHSKSKEKLWSQLDYAAWYHESAVKKNRIAFFDIDDTLMTLPARSYDPLTIFTEHIFAETAV